LRSGIDCAVDYAILACAGAGENSDKRQAKEELISIKLDGNWRGRQQHKKGRPPETAFPFSDDLLEA